MYSIRNTYTFSKTLSLALPIPDEYTAEGVRIARFESVVRIEEGDGGWGRWWPAERITVKVRCNDSNGVLSPPHQSERN
jgi:hypothetical protein